MRPIQAVLTGDLVASSEASASAVNRSMELLAATSRGIAAWRISENTVVGDTYFTRFRGDGWQIVVPAGAFGLRAALLTYATLAAKADLPKTRVAVGLSTIDAIPGTDLSDAAGAAFELSGRALARMERGERLKVAGNRITPLRTAFIALLNDRIIDWTVEQAQAIVLALPPDAPTQTVMAERLGISPQALSYRLTGAKWPTIRRILHEWEKPRPPEDRNHD
ncbi:MAG TPA: hypothetical protein PK450_07625 [Paracoccaceae bacterium]|nr:hypothetical protein [Paracoccaceae bacterium]